MLISSLMSFLLNPISVKSSLINEAGTASGRSKRFCFHSLRFLSTGLVK